MKCDLKKPRYYMRYNGTSLQESKFLLEAIVSSKRVSREKLAQDVHFSLIWAIADNASWEAARVLQRFYYHDLDGTPLIAPPFHSQVKHKRDMEERQWEMDYFDADI